MTTAPLGQNGSALRAARFARCAAAGRSWLVSERGPVHIFAIVWAIGVLVPLVISVFFSLLTAHGLRIQWVVSLHAYRDIVESGRWEVVVRTLIAAASVTVICLAVGFPFALWLAKRARSEKLIQFVWMALTVPFFLDPSARTLVWRGILGSTGLINAGLIKLHLIDTPLEWLLFSDFSVYLGLIGPYFPNMVMPIYLAILLIDNDLIQASTDLGATPATTLRNIIIPLAMPGIIAGIIFTFVPVMGDSIVPSILGGGKKEYLADSVMSLSTAMNYSGAAAFATIILTLTALLLGLFLLFRNRVSFARAGDQA
jgi:ABC-type spermidine/putrescine transport system permease subunit I